MQEIDNPEKGIRGENKVENFIKKNKRYFRFIDYLFKVLIIVIILFLIIEFLSFLFVEFYRNQVPNEKIFMDIYKNKTEAKEFFIETRDAFKFEYSPYVGYKKIPYQGKYINVDNNSIRKTFPNCFNKSGKSIKIFVFGGSTIWGSDVKDEETVPSYLSGYLCNKGLTVNVTNFGEEGYSLTEELIRLELQLRGGNYPDIVVFYDGVNEVFNSYQNGIAGTPLNYQDRIDDFNSRNKLNLKEAILNSNFVKKILSKIIKPPQKKIVLKENIDGDTTSIYINDTKIIKALEKGYGFKSFFYWQPAVFTKSNLSDEEKKIFVYEGYADLYNNVTNKLKPEDDVRDLSGLFNNKNNTIFTDFCHVTNEGNNIIAETIGKDIVKYLNKGNLIKK